MAKKKATPVKTESVEASIFNIDIPMADSEITFKSQHVNASLDLNQRAAHMSLLRGLQLTGKKLASGKTVNNGADAIRWILEQLPANVGEKDGARWSEVS